ncbi:hypothetical protein [Micromonospora sp. NPDC023814]|uniref:hypothetical protein n=1 Tax=Micromonospora sp. NPDC023814 TaxID=3154596 RepID=UPI0033C2EE43
MTRLDPEQVERNERGIAACRAVVGEVLARRDQPEPEKPLTRSDELLAAARAEAARQRDTLARLRRQTPALRRQETQP